MSAADDDSSLDDGAISWMMVMDTSWHWPHGASPGEAMRLYRDHLAHQWEALLAHLEQPPDL